MSKSSLRASRRCQPPLPVALSESMIGRLSPAGRCVRIQKRHCWKFLRSFYRQRCLHTRLRTYYPLRLRYFEHRKREQRGFAVDETFISKLTSAFPSALLLGNEGGSDKVSRNRTNPDRRRDSKFPRYATRNTERSLHSRVERPSQRGEAADQGPAKNGEGCHQ